MTLLKWLPILILSVGLPHPALAATVTFTVVEDTTLVDFSDEFFDLRNQNFAEPPDRGRRRWLDR